MRQMRQLMGFLSYYRAFVPNFATVTAPLTELLEGKERKLLSGQSQRRQAMQESKRLLWDACSRYAWDAGEGKPSDYGREWHRNRGDARTES